MKNVGLENLTEHELFRRSKENGLKHYDWKSVQGWKQLCSNLTPQFESTPENLVDQSPASIRYGIQQKTVNDLSQGTIILLLFGQDIPLPTSMGPSVGGLNSTLTFKLTVSSTDADSTPQAYLYYSYIYEEETVIASDGSALTDNPLLYDRSDMMRAINLWQKKVDSGHLYVNVHKMRGGSFFHDAFNKVRGVLAKVVPAVQKGIEMYHNKKDNINKGLDFVDNIASKVDHKHADSVRNLISNIKKRTP